MRLPPHLAMSHWSVGWIRSFFDRELEKNMIDGFNVGFKPYADKALAKVPEAKKEQMAKAIDRYRENV